MQPRVQTGGQPARDTRGAFCPTCLQSRPRVSHGTIARRRRLGARVGGGDHRECQGHRPRRCAPIRRRRALCVGDRVCSMPGTRRQFELSDAQWADRGSFLPPERGCRSAGDSTIDAWSTPCSGHSRTAASWGGNLPEHYPHCNSVCTRFCRCSEQGICTSVLRDLTTRRDTRQRTPLGPPIAAVAGSERSGGGGGPWHSRWSPPPTRAPSRHGGRSAHLGSWPYLRTRQAPGPTHPMQILCGEGLALALA